MSDSEDEQAVLQEEIARLEQQLAQENEKNKKGFKNGLMFAAPEPGWIEVVLRLGDAHRAYLAENHHVKGDLLRNHLGEVSALLGAARSCNVPPAECGGRDPKTGMRCEKKCDGEDVLFNWQVCVVHFNKHVFVRLVLRADGGAKLEPPKGDRGQACGVCREQTGRADYESCHVCGLKVHAECMLIQLEDVVDPEESLAFFCNACATEKWDQVCYLAEHLTSHGVQQLAVVEVSEELLARGSAETWDRAKPSVEKVFLLKAEEAPVENAPSPFQKAARMRSKVVDEAGGEEKKKGKKPAPAAKKDKAKPRSGGQAESSNRGAKKVEAASDEDEYEGGVDQPLGRKADLEKLVEALVAKAQQSGEPRELRAFLGNGVNAWSRVCPDGSRDGYKSGAAGAPNSREAFSKENWMGMRAVTKNEIATMTRRTGVQRLDMHVRNRDCPEEEGVQVTIELVEGVQVKTGTRASKTIPERMMVFKYWSIAAGEWEELRACGEDVFAPEHEDSDFFVTMATLICARYAYLGVVAAYLLTERGFSWGMVWRYSLLFTEQRYYRVEMEARSPLDAALLSAWLDENNRGTRLHALAVDGIQQMFLDQARAMTNAEDIKRRLREMAEGWTTGEGSTEMDRAAASAFGERVAPSAARGKGAKGCSLCGKQGHAYRSGDHSHVGEITVKCPLMLTDGDVCGQKHAFSGPLKSDCRGGLPKRMPEGKPVWGRQ
jgi:hypothetical protein